MWTIAWLFLKDLLTGELYRLWADHKAKEHAQAVADAPLTDQEEAEGLLK